MNWKKTPNWIKGGIIATGIILAIWIIFGILFTILGKGNCPGYCPPDGSPCYDSIKACFTNQNPGMAPIKYVATALLTITFLITPLFKIGLILTKNYTTAIITGLIIWFIIGAIIGKYWKKIKKLTKKKTSEKTKQWIIGIITFTILTIMPLIIFGVSKSTSATGTSTIKTYLYGTPIFLTWSTWAGPSINPINLIIHLGITIGITMIIIKLYNKNKK